MRLRNELLRFGAFRKRLVRSTAPAAERAASKVKEHSRFIRELEDIRDNIEAFQQAGLCKLRGELRSRRWLQYKADCRLLVHEPNTKTAIFRWPVLSCINVEFCNEILILQH